MQLLIPTIEILAVFVMVIMVVIFVDQLDCGIIAPALMTLPLLLLLLLGWRQ